MRIDDFRLSPPPSPVDGLWFILLCYVDWHKIASFVYTDSFSIVLCRMTASSHIRPWMHHVGRKYLEGQMCFWHHHTLNCQMKIKNKFNLSFLQKEQVCLKIGFWNWFGLVYHWKMPDLVLFFSLMPYIKCLTIEKQYYSNPHIHSETNSVSKLLTELL